MVNTVTDQAILSDTNRRELVHRFLADRDWETPYLQEAAELESFAGDVARLMETVAWQGASPDQTNTLIEIQDALSEFHAWLDDNGHIERGQLLSSAIDCLEDPDHKQAVVDVDAVLAVEFEEFYPIDRRYLEVLTGDLKLVCIEERDSSVRRNGVEAGRVFDQVSLTEESRETPSPPVTRPEATARYLATGSIPEDPEQGQVSVLHTESADEQADLVADEIERLREEHGWEYGEFAVALKRGGSAVSEAIKDLSQAGIPTESTTVTGFGDDPAVRELLDVTRQSETIAAGDADDATGDTPDDHGLLAKIHDEEESMATALRRWATESGLKARIAERESPLEARSQFGNVRRAFALAEFIEDTSFIDASWQSLREALERAHEYAPTETQTSAIDLDTGVRVDHLQALKNGSWRAVFILDVIDQEYPGDPFLTRLFPLNRVLDMPDFPGVTDVTAGEVQATFQTDSTASSQPIKQYHTELSRRQLAIGANAATDELRFCLYDHANSALDEQVQPSRFLTDVYRQLPWVEAGDDSGIWSERRATEFALARIDRALADIRRTQSRDATVGLENLEADLAAIQDLLNESGEHGERVREAVRARIDFAAGRVRRE